MQKNGKRKSNLGFVFVLSCCVLFSACASVKNSKKETTSATVSDTVSNAIATNQTTEHGSFASPPELQQLHETASMGDSAALYRLGLCYIEGNLVVPDREKGFEFLRQAAVKNHPNAKYQVGLCYADGIGTAPNQGEAAHWMISAAQENHAEAKQWLLEQRIYIDTKKTKSKKTLFSSST